MMVDSATTTTTTTTTVMEVKKDTRANGKAQVEISASQQESEPHSVDGDAATSTKAVVAVCMECQTNRFQYVCPRCAFKSCSLKCCKAHKERLKCNGKRDRTAFVPIRRMNDATLQNDYHFLEDVCEQMETSKHKTKGTTGGGGRANHFNNNHRKRPRQQTNHPEGGEGNDEASTIPPHPLLQSQQQSGSSVVSIIAGRASAPPHLSRLNLHPKWREFATLAWERHRTQILYMPSGMHRRMLNKSYIQHPSKKNSSKRKRENDKDTLNDSANNSTRSVLHWTLEWRLYNPKSSTPSKEDDKNDDKASTSTSATTMTSTSAVSETCSIGDALVQQMQKNKGQEDDGTNVSTLLELYTVFIAMSNQPQKLVVQQKTRRPKTTYYRKVSMESTIAEALQDTRVIEYPTLEVVHESRLEEFPQFIQTLSDDDNNNNDESKAAAGASAG